MARLPYTSKVDWEHIERMERKYNRIDELSQGYIDNLGCDYQSAKKLALADYGREMKEKETEGNNAENERLY